MSGPAVVIGSGPNGLAAAITLAEAGRDVTVLEAADHAGGAVATDELTLPGFRHDTFSAVYPAAAASPVFARWPLEGHGLRWVHPRYCYAHPLPDGTAAVLCARVGETAASLDAAAPGDGRPGRSSCSRISTTSAHGATRCSAASRPCAGATRLAASLGPAAALEWVRLLLMPAQALAAQLFSAAGARAWLYGAAMHGDVPPHGAGSAIAAAHLNVMGHAVGWPSPEGGAARLAGALAGHLRELGGVIRTRAPVTAIRAERGRVTGVTVAGSESVRAELVIADVTPHALLDLAGEALDGRYASRLRRYRYGPSTLKVDWALDGPMPWAAEEAREAGTVHVGGGEDEMLAALRAVAGGLAERPFMLLGQQSVADPTRAPAGKHTAWAYTHGPHDVDWEGERDRARRADGGADRALRARLPRPDPRPPRARPGRPRGPRRQPRRRRRGRVARTRSTRWSSARCPPCARTARRCAGCTSAAPRRSPAAPSTASRATARHARRSPRHRLRRFTSLPWRSP